MNKDLVIKMATLKPETAFAPPECKIFIYESTVLNDLNIQKIKDIILSKENEIKLKYPYFDDGNTGLGKNSLTSRYPYFNLFQWPELIDLNNIVKKTYINFLKNINESYVDIYGQCWANVMRKDEQIKKHSHYNDTLSYLGGHICIDTVNTSTHYINPFTKEVYSSENKIGKITLFPNWIEHYTDIVKTNLRITVAFDLFTEKFYDKIVKINMKEHWKKL